MASDKLVAVVGPTGSGKTALAVDLAKKFNGVLISADSRQVYKRLDIGTNKEGIPGEWHGQQARFIDNIPQLLINIRESGEAFTLHDWLEKAKKLLDAIWERGQLPIVVGGTGLYVTALIDGYEPGEGRYAQKKALVSFDALVLQRDIDRNVLYKKSDERFERIFDSLINETNSLLKEGVSREWLEKIGLDYRFASYFIHHRMNRELAISEFQQASRQYIRRQLTWWRHHNSPVLIRSTKDAEEKVGQFLKSS